MMCLKKRYSSLVSILVLLAFSMLAWSSIASACWYCGLGGPSYPGGWGGPSFPIYPVPPTPPAPPNRIPTISSTATTVANINTTYQYQLSASDGDGHSLSYSLPTAPAGMTINGSGFITWIPTAFGSYPVTVNVSDGYGGNKTQSFTIAVTNQDPVISSQPNTNAYLNTLYTYQVSAADSDNQSLSYSLDQAPAGMTISNSGLISWPQPQLGAETISLTVNDGFGGSAQQTFVINTFTTNLTGLDQDGLFTLDPTSDPKTVGSTAGEFSVSQDGSAFYTIPIGISPGTAGLQPSLALSYNSNSGNGIAGMGWSLGGLSSITRCSSNLAEDGLKRSIDFTANDHLCLEGERLITIGNGTDNEGAYTEYRKKTDPATRIRSYGLTAGQPDKFRVWTKTGQIFDYAFTADSRIEVPNSSAVFTWAVNKIADTVGNYLTVSYNEDNANGDFRPTRIDYTANDAAGLTAYNSVRFNYENRTDTSLSKIAGKTFKVMKRLSSVQAYAGTNKVHEYNLAYSQSPVSQVSIVASITECAGDGSCLQPTTFDWQTATGALQYNNSISKTISAVANGSSTAFGDVNGDGLVDIVTATPATSTSTQVNLKLHIATENGFLPAVLSTYSRVCQSITTTNRVWVNPVPSVPAFGRWVNNTVTSIVCTLPKIRLADYNSDGRADLIYSYKSAEARVKLSTGNSFETATQRLVGIDLNYSEFGDINGDDQLDVVIVTTPPIASPYVNNQTVSIKGAFSIGNGNTISLTTLGQYTRSCVTKSENKGLPIGYVTSVTCDTVGQFKLGDVNGDGLDDVVLSGPSDDYYVYTFFSKGNSLAPKVNFNAPNTLRFWLGDINGDGLSDLVTLGGTFQKIYMQLSVANNFGTVAELGTVGTWWAAGAALADTNGDGLADFISIGEGGYDGKARVRTVSVPSNDLMTKITSSFGVSTTINYSKLTNSAVYTASNNASLPAQDLSKNALLDVVASVTTPDGIGGNSTSTYHYSGGKQDTRGRGFLGFETMAVTDETSGTITTTTYRQDYPYSGQIHSTQTKLADGTVITELENTLAQKSLFNGKVILPYIAESVQAQHEINGRFISSAVTDYTLDDFGNTTDIVVATSGENSQLDSNGDPLAPTGFDTYTTHTVNTYSNDENNWFIGRLTRVDNTQTLPNGNSDTRSSSFSYDAVTGLLSQEIIEPDNAALRQVTDYQYDVYGNQTTVTVSASTVAPRTTTTVWGERDTSSFGNIINNGRFAVTISNALGQSEHHAFDPRTGKMTQLRGPNGLDTFWEYDTFGRILREIHADGSIAATLRARCTATTCPANGLTKVITMQSGSVPSVVVSDQLGRAIRTATLARNGQVIYSDTDYDNRGQVSRKSLPYFSGDTVYWNSFQYDVLGRVYAETSADGSTNTTGFHGLATTVRNSANQLNERTTNVLGNVVQVFDADANDTYYRYDAFGNLIETEDANGNIIHNSYDIRGRKIAMDDPDMGHWTYSYNALGELISQTDAKGQTVTMSYDKLGRLISRTEAEGTSTWQYDTATNGIGKLHTETGPLGNSKTLSYDNLGRATQVISTIENSRYTTSTAYDSHSRVSQITYPASNQYPNGLKVDYTYTHATTDGADGYLKTVENHYNSTVFWHARTQNAAGQLTEIQLGNGIRTKYHYNAQTNLIDTIRSFTPGGNYDVQNLGFIFDTIGNLKRRTDYNQYQGLTALNEQFSYDSLNRMTRSTVLNQSSKLYAYDALGNITSKTGVGSYSYGTNAGPHAVTQTNLNGTLTHYQYDANGNMISGNGRTISYTSYNKPTLIANATRNIQFTYGADRARIIRKDLSTGKTRYYIGSLFERETHNGLTTDIHYIKAGGCSIAIVTSKSDGSHSVNYLHKDHLGSVTAITDHTGLVIEQQSYDPHGKRRHSDWTDISGTPAPSATTDRGFTGHEHIDEVGLVHMNGRVYDPTLGRFISADPNIQSPLNSQSLNRYSYVMNNPLSFTDPSGFFFKKLFKSIFRAIGSIFKGVTKFIKSILNNQILRTIAAVAIVAFAPQWAGIYLKGFAAGFVGSGGDLKAGILGAVTAGAFNFVGDSQFANDLYSKIGNAATRIVKTAAHGLVGGLSSAVQGGKFVSGFLSAGVTQAFAPRIGTSFATPQGRITAAAVLGGTSSVLGGGKFANGALTGAFSRAFNDEYQYNKSSRVVSSKMVQVSVVIPSRTGFFGKIRGVVIDYVSLRKGGVSFESVNALYRLEETKINTRQLLNVSIFPAQRVGPIEDIGGFYETTNMDAKPIDGYTNSTEKYGYYKKNELAIDNATLYEMLEQGR